MARIKFIAPIASVSGRTNKEHDTYFRQQNGKTVAVALLHPRTKDKASAKESAYRARVGELSKEASRINHDENLAQPYNDWQKLGYTSRYRYILATLIKAVTNNITST